MQLQLLCDYISSLPFITECSATNNKVIAKYDFFRVSFDLNDIGDEPDWPLKCHDDVTKLYKYDEIIKLDSLHKKLFIMKYTMDLYNNPCIRYDRGVILHLLNLITKERIKGKIRYYRLFRNRFDKKYYRLFEHFNSKRPRISSKRIAARIQELIDNKQDVSVPGILPILYKRHSRFYSYIAKPLFWVAVLILLSVDPKGKKFLDVRPHWGAKQIAFLALGAQYNVVLWPKELLELRGYLGNQPVIDYNFYDYVILSDTKPIKPETMHEYKHKSDKFIIMVNNDDYNYVKKYYMIESVVEVGNYSAWGEKYKRYIIVGWYHRHRA